MPENIPFDKFLAPAEPPEKTKKRLRGGQPGNLNALKHGLYVQGNYILNLTPIERADLCDFNDIIIHFKTYTEYLFELGIASKDLAHLIHTQVRNCSFFTMQEENEKSNLSDSPFQSMYRGLLKSMSKYMDVSDLEAAIDRPAASVSSVLPEGTEIEGENQDLS